MSAALEPAEWRRRAERGSPLLLRTMAWLSLHWGRGPGRALLHLVAGYYFLFAPGARRSMRAYLRRALGRAPRAVDRYRLIRYFANTVQDRLYMLSGRYDQFEITVQGEALIRELVDTRSGAFLFGAHVGSFEVLRFIGDRQPGLAVAMAMYEDNARKLNAVMASARPRNAPLIIALGHVDAMLRIREQLDQGALVGVLADRRLGDEAAVAVDFLGAKAHLPLGPMRAAALLRRQVLFMVGLYRGGRRYHVVFEPLADFTHIARARRAEAVEAAVRRYGRLLEQYCRSDPYNWFNFFDFWAAPRDGVHAAQPRAEEE